MIIIVVVVIFNGDPLSAPAERRHDGVNKMGKKVVPLAGERGGVPQLCASVR